MIADLVESGRVHVLPEDPRTYPGLDDACRRLAATGIIGYRSSGSFHLIEPRRYVGNLRLPNSGIRIRPRRPELFGQLQQIVARNAGKLVKEVKGVERGSTEDIDSSTAFLKTALRAIDHGLPFEYSAETGVTSNPRGKLRVTPTVRRLYTRGIRHQVICSVPLMKLIPEVSSVVKSAATFLERSGLLRDPRNRAELDLCLRFVDDAEELVADEAVRLADQLVDSEFFDAPIVECLRAAAAMLDGRAISWQDFRPVESGWASFSLVDNLWELVVLNAATETSRPQGLTAVFHPYRNKQTLLFGTGGPDIDPDIVVFREGTAHVVLDAKYKMVSGAISGDVYQVACYGDRLGADVAVLVYVSEGDGWRSELGSTTSGTSVWAIGVPQHRVNVGLANLVQGLFDTAGGLERGG